MKHPSIARTLILASLLLAAPIGIKPAYAHCDGMDGPVVKAARQALAAGDVNLVLRRGPSRCRSWRPRTLS